MATYTDDFNRSTLGTDWPSTLNGGTWNINASVRARQQAAGGSYRGLRYLSGMDGADVDVTVVFRASSGAGGGVLIRCPESGTAAADIDGYAIVAFPGDAFYIIRMDGGDDGGVGYGYVWGTAAANTDYTLRITVEGTTITGYVDGTQRFTFTDSTYAGGSGNRGVALLSYGATPEWDSFSALDIVSGQTVTPGAIASTATVYSPVVSQSGGAQTVIPGAIASTATVYSPAALPEQFVQPDPVSGAEYALRFYGNGTGQIDRARIPLEDGASTQYPPNVGAGSFTYEAWIRCAYDDNASTATDEDARYSNIVFDRDDYNAQRGHVWGVTRSGANLVVCFGQAGGGGTWATIFGTTDVGDNAWHHVAITRNQSTGAVTIWVDGASDASDTYDTTDWSFPAGRTNPSGQDNEYIVLGTEKHDVGYGYNGHLDELRISDTVRYTGSFSPARRLQTDSNAVGLWRFDTGTGTTIADSATVSGAPTNGELLVGGTPSGPVWVAASTGALAPSSVVHAPTVVLSGMTIVPDPIASGAVVYEPSAIPGAVVVVPGAIASGESVPAPAVQPGAVTVALDTIASGAVVYDPTVDAGGSAIVPDPIASGAVVYEPTAQPGAVVVVPGTIGAGAVVYDPEAQPGAVTVVPDAIDAGAVVYEPYVGGGSVVTPDTIASTAVVHAPTVQPGAVAVQPDPVASGAVVHAVVVSATVTVQPDSTGDGAVVHEPVIVTAQIVTPGAIVSTAVVYEPYVGGGSVVTPDPIASGAVVYEPSAIPGAVVVVPGTIGAGAVVYDPEAQPGAVVVVPGAIASGESVPAPAVVVSIIVQPGAIASGAVVYDLEAQPGAVVVQPDPVASGAVVYEPFFGSGTAQYVQAGAIDSGASVPAIAVVIVVASRSYRIQREDRTVTVAAQDRTITIEE